MKKFYKREKKETGERGDGRGGKKREKIDEKNQNFIFPEERGGKKSEGRLTF